MSDTTVLRDLRLSKSIPAKEMVDVVRELYPKYDKTLQSKCERGNEYGIDLKVKAWYALLEKYDPERLEREKYRRGGCHKLHCRVTCRLGEKDYTALVAIIKEEGFDTMQAWLAYRIKAYLKANRKEQQ